MLYGVLYKKCGEIKVLKQDANVACILCLQRIGGRDLCGGNHITLSGRINSAIT